LEVLEVGGGGEAEGSGGAGAGAGADSEGLAAAADSRVAAQEGDSSRMAPKLTIDTLGDAVARALGPRLVSLILYGSAARGTHVASRSDMNTLLICDRADETLFAALAPVMREWRRAGQVAPLILTEREWRASGDVFSIEYEDIRQHHRVLAGRDPWSGIVIDRADLRRQLERELMEKLIRLRQAYAALRDEPKQLAQVIVGSAGGFFTILRAVLRLAGRSAPGPAEAVVSEAGALVGFPPAGLEALVRHAGGGATLRLDGGGDRLVASYLTALARTAEYVNSLS
jgi:predicted nucleotidyltransferase